MDVQKTDKPAAVVCNMTIMCSASFQYCVLKRTLEEQILLSVLCGTSKAFAQRQFKLAAYCKCFEIMMLGFCPFSNTRSMFPLAVHWHHRIWKLKSRFALSVFEILLKSLTVEKPLHLRSLLPQGPKQTKSKNLTRLAAARTLQHDGNCI